MNASIIIDVSPKAVSLSSGQESSLTLEWTVPSDANLGEYDATFAVWKEYDAMNNQLRGEPVQDVTVKIQAIKANETFTGQTNEEGIVSFESHFMNYEISVFASNYEKFKSSMVVLHDSPSMNYNVTLNDLHSTNLTIIVQDNSGKRLGGAHVNLISEHANFASITDKDGIISFSSHVQATWFRYL
ncbi:MAG: carboxypeptidase-like regulatory domain-containing protein [Nitrososphaerales archaeon]